MSLSSLIKTNFEEKHSEKYGTTLVKPSQSYTNNSDVGLTTLSLTPFPSNFNFTSPSNLDFYIGTGLKGLIEKMWLNITLTQHTGSSMPVNPLFLFDRIEIWANKGSGDLLETIYPEKNLLHLSLLSSERIQVLSQDIGMVYNSVTNSADLNTSGLSLAQSRTYNIPFYSWLGDHVKWFSQGVNQDLLIRLRTTSNGATCMNGDTPPTMTACNFIVQHEHLTPSDLQTHRDFWGTKVQNFTYVDTAVVSYNDTYGPNKTVNLDLSNLSGKLAGLVFTCRASKSSFNFGNTNFLSFGNSTVDIISPSGQSVFGNGSPVSLKFLKSQMVNRQLRGSFGNVGLGSEMADFHVLSFTDDLAATLQMGSLHGWFGTNGEKYSLRLNLAADFNAGSSVNSTIDIYALQLKDLIIGNGNVRSHLH
jgi:hypothetical protein